MLQMVGDFIKCCLIIHIVKATGIDHDASAHVGFSHGLPVKILIFRFYDHYDLQTIFFGKIKVALIMGGNRHDRTGTIFHQGKIGGIHWYPFAGHGV